MPSDSANVCSWWWTGSNRRAAKTTRLTELNEKIARYKALSARLTDELALSGIALLIEHYEMQKRELHAEQKE
jgi:hypothetical protein